MTARPFGSDDLARVGRLLVVRAGALGDLIVTVPALRALRAGARRAHITFVGNAAAPLLAPDVFDTFIGIDDPRALPLFGGATDADQTLAADAAILWLNDPAGERADALRRCGVDVVLQAPPIPSETGLHTVDHLIATLAPLGVSPVVDVDAERWLRPATGILRSSRSVLVVHPGSGGARKNWGGERFAVAAEALAASLDLPVIVVEGPGDADAVADLTTRLRRPFERIVPRDLTEAVALVRSTRLYLGNDSGLSHLVAAMGAPTVAVFGPTDPRTWSPRGPRVRVVAPAEPGPMATHAPPVAAVVDAARDLVLTP